MILGPLTSNFGSLAKITLTISPRRLRMFLKKTALDGLGLMPSFAVSSNPLFIPLSNKFSGAHLTCESVWAQEKAIYTNDTQQLYGVCQSLMNLIAPKQLDGLIYTYLGQIHGALHNFNELLPPANTSAKELEQRSTFFMLMALYGLPPDYSGIRDQILGSPTVPTLSTVWSSLLRIPAKQTIEPVPAPAPVDTSALVSQSNNRGRSHNGRSRPKCDHCHRLGHTIDKCWTLHGRAPWTINVAQTAALATSESPDQHKPSSADYADFLKWYEQHQSSSSTASVAHTGNSFACLSQSTSLGP